MQRNCRVKCNLSAHSWQDRIRLLLLDDLFDVVRCDGLYVRRISDVRIRHDRCRVRVDEHDSITLFSEYLTGLRS